jgi:hypothetical protein
VRGYWLAFAEPALGNPLAFLGFKRGQQLHCDLNWSVDVITQVATALLADLSQVSDGADALIRSKALGLSNIPNQHDLQPSQPAPTIACSLQM